MAIARRAAAPRLVPFPAIRLLFGLQATEETPHRTPWWLLALRLALATLLIVGLAHPLLNPGTPLEEEGPLLLIVDDSWSAAANWDEMRAIAADLIAQAERQGRPVVILGTAPQASDNGPRTAEFMRAAEASRRLQAMEPKPWRADYAATADAIASLKFDGVANVFWLAGGIVDEPSRTRPTVAATDNIARLADTLGRFGPVHLVSPPDHALPVQMTAPIPRPRRSYHSRHPRHRVGGVPG